MAQVLIKEGTFFHNLLLQQLNQNIQTTLDIKAFAQEILQTMEDCSRKLTSSSRNFIKKVKEKQFKIDETIGILNRYILDITGDSIKKINGITKKVQNQVIDPLEHFINSYMQQNKNVLQKSEQMLCQIQSNSCFLQQLTKNFSQNKANLEFTANQKIELRKIYEAQMQRCNQNWQIIKNSYLKILQQVDSSNSSRIIFANKTQVKLIKAINRLLGSELLEDRLQEYEDGSEQTELFSLYLKQRIREQLGKSNLFEEDTFQELKQLANSGENKLDMLDKMEIDHFIETFTSRSNVREEEKDYQRARMLITQDHCWGTYFLAKLQKRTHTQIRLATVKYHQLTTIMKYLFAHIVQLQENDAMVYNLLYISYRISNNGSYIIQELGKYQDFWYENQRWFDIINYIKQIKVQSKKRKSQAPASRRHLIFFSSIWNFHKSQKRKATTSKQIKSEKFISQSKDYQNLCEVNYFMAKLELSEKFVFNFIIEASNRFGISRDNAEKLLKFHYFHKKISTNMTDQNSLRKKKFEIKYRNLQRVSQKTAVCVGKALRYLPLGPNMVSFRLVCKKWNIHLKDEIFERYLVHQRSGQTINAYRLRIYLQISESAYEKQVFERMINQMPQFTQHSEIIELDVKRSLAWDQSLRSVLVQILKAFAFYHPDVGYLQGMNYLCENILKLSDNKFHVYRIFQYLMTHQFDGLYTYNFDKLRIKIYSFMRILQREMPKLYDHFEAEKLQGEHFLLSWAITLWGQMSGDLVWVLWDGFIIKGWKWWIKTGLWLFKKLEGELISMNFEELMKCFSDLNATFLNANKEALKQFGIQLNKVKQQIDSLTIQDETLQDLQKEYKLKVSMIRDYIKRVKN